MLFVVGIRFFGVFYAFFICVFYKLYRFSDSEIWPILPQNYTNVCKNDFPLRKYIKNIYEYVISKCKIMCIDFDFIHCCLGFRHFSKEIGNYFIVLLSIIIEVARSRPMRNAGLILLIKPYHE